MTTQLIQLRTHFPPPPSPLVRTPPPAPPHQVLESLNTFSPLALRHPFPNARFRPAHVTLVAPEAFARGGPEILAEIVRLASPETEFDFLQTDWAQGVEYTTLKALCLTSRVFNDLVTPHLYSHLVVPTAQIARSLITTLESDRWQTGERAGKAHEWTEFITVGSKVALGEELDGAFVKKLLSKFVGGRLLRLSIAGVIITGADTFTTLDDLKFLQLKQVAYDFSHDDPLVTLDNVTHLHAEDVRMFGISQFLELVDLPGFTHFASRNTVPSRNWEYWIGLRYVASALEFLAQQEPLDIHEHEASLYISSLTHLKHLVILPSSFPGDEVGSCLHYLLLRLSNPLGVLDLAALSSEHASSHSSALSEALRHASAGLSCNTVLRLPGPDARGLRRRGQLGDAAVELGRVADLADERGVTVEWL